MKYFWLVMTLVLGVPLGQSITDSNLEEVKFRNKTLLCVKGY